MVSTKSSTIATVTRRRGRGHVRPHDDAARPGGRRVRHARAPQDDVGLGVDEGAVEAQRGGEATGDVPRDRSAPGLGARGAVALGDLVSARRRARADKPLSGSMAARAPDPRELHGRNRVRGRRVPRRRRIPDIPATHPTPQRPRRSASALVPPLPEGSHLRRVPSRAPHLRSPANTAGRPVRWSPAAAAATRARSSVDRALASGARGHRFESCRARSAVTPALGPALLSQPTAARPDGHSHSAPVGR